MARRRRGRSYHGWDSYWPSYPRTQRRAATGGIKARSQRGAIGETWWSRRFIAILESFQMGARLSRGRSYARSGQVMDLEVTPGRVSARVQGSRRTPYQVRIDLTTLSERDWAHVERTMSEQALFMARLLAGEMPQEIEQAFAACQLSLFPARGRDLDTDCSCPDWANPCKHIAATYYILAERFDEDPFLVFAWRGRSQQDLIEELRRLRGQSAVDAGDADEARPATPPDPETPGLEPLPASHEAFWATSTPPEALPLQPAHALAADALLRQAGAASLEIRGRDLRDLLAPAYARLAAAAESLALGGPPGER